MKRRGDTTRTFDPVADLNRRDLRRSGVFTVCVTGGPACGKTTLIERSVERLTPDVRTAVVVCDVASQTDAAFLRRRGVQVVAAGIGCSGAFDAGEIRNALQEFDLSSLDLLLVENVGSLIGPPLDLGQDVTVPLFSVAGGDGAAHRHPELVRAGPVVVLSKTDLLPFVPFDLDLFRAEVRALNPSARLIELSGLRDDGLGPWLAWIRESRDDRRVGPRHNLDGIKERNES